MGNQVSRANLYGFPRLPVWLSSLRLYASLLTELWGTNIYGVPKGYHELCIYYPI